MAGYKVGYARVSTEDQNPDRQLEGETLDKKFIDYASGKNTDRAAFQQMVEFVREGDELIVHSMDRLARNLRDLRKIVDSLVKKQVKIRFIKENLIFTGEDSPMANLLLNLIGAVAEFERAIILERQREGIAIAKRKGLYKGRVKQLSDEEEELLVSMVQEGYKPMSISAKFGIARTTVYHYINRNKKRAKTEVDAL